MEDETKGIGGMQDVEGVYQEGLIGRVGVRGIPAGYTSRLCTPPPFSFPRAYVSSLSPGTDLNQAVV